MTKKQHCDNSATKELQKQRCGEKETKLVSPRVRARAHLPVRCAL